MLIHKQIICARLTELDKIRPNTYVSSTPPSTVYG